MQAQASLGLWEFVLFWFFTGSGLLGLPPGDRDASLVKAVPPQTLAYFEWAARGNGKPGASGVDGFAADPEIQQFFELLDAAFEKREIPDEDEPNHELRAELPRLVKLVTAHPGCLFLGFEPMRQNSLGMEGWLNSLKGIHGGVILSAGADADTIWKSLNHSLTSVNDFHYDEASLTQSIPLPFPGYQLVVHREGERIVFALGEGTLTRAIDGLSNRQPGLDTNPRFREAMARIAIPRTATVGWLDCKGIMSSITTALGPLGGLVKPILATAGADALDYVVQSSGVEGGTMIQRTFTATGGRTSGIMALAGGQPILPQHFSHVPADSDLVIAASVSLTTIYREARQLLAKTQPLSVRIFDEAIKQLETELELKVVDDVLPAFGDVVTAFDSPAAGGMIATSLVVSLEVRDFPKAKLVFDRLIKLADQSLSLENTDAYTESPSVRNQTFLGNTVYYISNSGPGYGAHWSMNPSFCLTQRHLYIAVHPQAIKAQLRHLEARRPGFDQQANQKVALPNGDVLGYAYLNGPRASSITSAILPFFTPAFLTSLEMEGLSMDPFSIPSAAAISPYFGDSTAVVTRQKDGLLIETRNAPPVTVSLGLLSIYRAWNSTDFEFLEEARRRKANGVEQAQLGPVGDDVVPAHAESKEKEPVKPAPKPSSYRKFATILVKSLIPDDIRSTIPESAFQELEQGPSAATLQRREEARQRREEMRRKREERRGARNPAQ